MANSLLTAVINANLMLASERLVKAGQHVGDAIERLDAEDRESGMRALQEIENIVADAAAALRAARALHESEHRQL